MAYSSGFNPHPRISYAGASPTGAASEAEYLELALAEVLVPAEVQELLDASLPPGLDVLAVVESPGGSLSDRLQPVAGGSRSTYLAPTRSAPRRRSSQLRRSWSSG